MALTLAQLIALKADFDANEDQAVIDALAAGDMGALVKLYVAPASPDFFVWRSEMSATEICELVDWTEVVAQDTNTLLCFRVLTNGESVDPSKASVRQAFASIFSGAGRANSLAALNSGAKRLANGIEKIFATGGDGSEGDPAILVIEGGVTVVECVRAIQS